LRKKMNHNGFTILEVMVGLVIFSVGLLTLLSMISISISGNSWSEKTTKTVQMVRETMETIKNTSISDMEYYGYDEQDGVYRSWYIEDDYEVDGLKRVTVWLYWHDDFNRSQYTSTTTYFKPKE
jgi:prepilin-type N-terminal cleavage/methylation domain-containing protein